MLTAEIKLSCLALKYYQHYRWEPKIGDFYTICRDDLELFKIIEDNGKEFGIIPYPNDNNSEPSYFAKSEFTDGDFGKYRVFVLPQLLDGIHV